MSILRISCFANFRATLDGNPIRTFDTEKTKALLAYLASEADRPHRREYLAGLLWSDQPEKKALHNLRQTLSYLRKALGEDNPEREPDSPLFLLITRETVQLNSTSEVWLDLRSFKEQIKTGLRFYRSRNGRGTLNIRGLKQAIEIYRGAFLDQMYLQGSPLFDEWSMLQREECNRQAIEALSLLAEYHEQRAEYSLARRSAARLVELAPWDETAYTQLMRLYALDGQWSAAQAQYVTLRRLLKEQLGLEPAAETTALFENLRQAAAQNRPIALRFALAPHNLPLADTPFVGRQSEMDALANQLADPDCRLITLLGPGGIGKTRLALESAFDQVGLYPDGVYIVPLAAVRSSNLLAPTIADALGFKFYAAENPETQLINFLREKSLLLLLDNFEQLLDGTGLVLNILHQSPGVKVMVTSRTVLNLRAENVFEIEGLTYPSDLSFPSGGQDTRDFSALQLFEQTARRVQPQFSLAAEIPAVTHICQLLEGLPLGIELSATWVQAYDCITIAAQIEQSLDFLTSEMRDVPERHRNVRAVFEHSWALLKPEMQQIFSRLSVFRGGFTSDAAMQVCEAQPSQLKALVNNSLLQETSPDRYELHNLLLQFAHVKLLDNPSQAQVVQAKHSNYFTSWLAQQTEKLYSPQQQETLDRIAQEIENTRTAWQWAVEQRKFTQIEQASPALSGFYRMRSRFQEGRDTFAHAVQALQSETPTPQSHRNVALLCIHQGIFETSLGNYEEARRLAEASFETLQSDGTPTEIAFALDLRANAAIEIGEFQQAKLFSEKALALLESPADSPARAFLLNVLGDANRILGVFDASQAQYQAMLTIYKRLADGWGLARAYNSLGILAGTRGQYEEAKENFQKSLATFRQIGDRAGTARILHNLSILAYIDQDYEKTRQLRLECLDICRAIGFQWGITSELKHLADVEKAMGDYEQARAHYEESLVYGRRANDRKSMAYALDSLGGLALQQKELAQARACYLEALETAIEIDLTPVAVDTLCGIAELLAMQNQIGQAIELLAFVTHHPAIDQQTRSKAENLMANMVEKLSPDEMTNCRERGKHQSLETIARELTSAS
jgi:predicted ATPase/DNA-binding SARP family transcriptional activator